MKAFLFLNSVLKRYREDSNLTTDLTRDGDVREGPGKADLPWSQERCRCLQDQVGNCPHGWAGPRGERQRAVVFNIITFPHRVSGNCLVAFPGMLPAISSLECWTINYCQKKLSNEQPQSAEPLGNRGWFRVSFRSADRWYMSSEEKEINTGKCGITNRLKLKLHPFFKLVIQRYSVLKVQSSHSIQRLCTTKVKRWELAALRAGGPSPPAAPFSMKYLGQAQCSQLPFH